MEYPEHKYEDVMPKRLKWSALNARYPALDKMTQEQTREYFRALDRHYLARKRWICRHGRTALPMRRFWYGGVLYTHLTPDGPPLHDAGWRRPPAPGFFQALRPHPAPPRGDPLPLVQSAR